MSPPSSPLPTARKPLKLAKFATLFALIFSLAFGLGSVAGISISGGGNYRAAALLIDTSVIIGAVCIVALLALGVVGMLRARRNH